MNKQDVVNVVYRFVKAKQPFTVYQVWDHLNHEGRVIPYNLVRKEVENIIDDYHSDIPGWTRTVGNHLSDRKLDRKVGKVGEPPQIYHPVGFDVTQYDPDFRLYAVPSKKTNMTGKDLLNSLAGLGKDAFKMLGPVGEELQKVKPHMFDKKRNKNRGKAGLFQFKVWNNGQLVDCNLLHERNPKGHFVKAQPYEAVGYLPDGSKVVVRQDNEGKLYALTNLKSSEFCGG